MGSVGLQPDPDQSSKPSSRHFSTVDRFIRGEITLDEYVRLAGKVVKAESRPARELTPHPNRNSPVHNPAHG